MIRIPFEHLPGTCDTTPYHTMREGWIILTEDSHQLYVDIEGTKHYFGDIVQCDVLPTENINLEKFYYVKDNNTINKYVNDEWVTIGGSNEPAVNPIKSTTTVIETNDWNLDSKSYTSSVNGVTDSNIIIVSPTTDSSMSYTSNGCRCVTQKTDSLTFTCNTVPTENITVNIVIMSN